MKITIRTTNLQEDYCKLITGHQDLVEVIENIRNNTYLPELTNYALGKGKKEDYLPSFIPTMILNKYVREDKWCDSDKLTGLMCYDVDGVTEHVGRCIVEALHHTDDLVYSFISPSGGVKFGIRTDIGEKEFDRFKIVWEYYAKHFDKMLNLFGAKCDQQPKAKNNQVYVSCDPKAYCNVDSTVYFTNFIKQPVQKREIPVYIDDDWASNVKQGLVEHQQNLNQKQRLVIITCMKRLGWSLWAAREVDQAICLPDTKTTTERLWKSCKPNMRTENEAQEILDKKGKVRETRMSEIHKRVKNTRNV